MGQQPKAILVLDNGSAHSLGDELKSNDWKIIAKFLPPNALIQPMDQIILESTKRFYKKFVLRDILSQTELEVDQLTKNDRFC